MKIVEQREERLGGEAGDARCAWLLADPFVAKLRATLQGPGRAEAVRLLREERHVSAAAAERFVAELTSSRA